MKLGKLIFLFSLLIFVLTGCSTSNSSSNSNIESNSYYTVDFNSQGGSSVDSQRVMENNPVVRPENPTYEDHFFLGWYETAAATEDTLWDFNLDRVTSDLVLYASWQSLEVEEEATVSLTYTKVETGYEVSGVGDEERIIIPSSYENESVVGIGPSAFARKQITSVQIPDTVTSIGLNAFHNASSLREVRIGEDSNLTTIGNNAFSGNSSLESIYLPASLESIGNSAFNNASSLNSIVVSSENTYYYSTGNNLIETATNTLLRGSNTSIIPEGVKIIASAAFRRSSIESITIPSTVEKINSYVFDDCTSLKEINVAASNQYYSSLNGLLYSKDFTTLITVPEGCISSVELAAGLVEIPSFAFDGISTIPSIIIPRSITGIRSFAFRGVTAHLTYNGNRSEWEDIAKHSTWGGENLNVTCLDDSHNVSTTYTIYFSATGTTKGIANLISEYTNSLSYEITAKIPYTSADINYSNSSCRANQEQNDSTSRPAIGSDTIDLSNVDTIYLGYPIWWGKAPKIVYTFLDTYDLSGKTIITFCTSGSSSIGSSMSDLRGLEANATWITGQRFSSSATISTIGTWIDSLNNK